MYERVQILKAAGRNVRDIAARDGSKLAHGQEVGARDRVPRAQ